MHYWEELLRCLAYSIKCEELIGNREIETSAIDSLLKDT